MNITQQFQGWFFDCIWPQIEDRPGFCLIFLQVIGYVQQKDYVVMSGSNADCLDFSAVLFA